MLKTDNAVLHAAYEAWSAGASLRRLRRRHKDYTYGRQWDDLVTTSTGQTLPEGEFSRRNGRSPQTNNLIRQLVKNIVGRFRNRVAQEGAPSDARLAQCAALNCLDEIDARMLEEFLISGCALQRVTTERRPMHPRPQVWVDNVSPDRFFVNRYSDPRGWDIELVGMLHDMSLTECLMRYSHGDAERRRRIARAYEQVASGSPQTLQVGAPPCSDAFTEGEPGRCRVIEVWTLESRETLRCHDTATGDYFLAEGATAALPPRIRTRAETTLVWQYRFFAPDGTLLDSGRSPYRHGAHPFCVKMFPMTDGEVHSFVEDIIDQQRHINRLLTLIDYIMSHSAKGVLLFPTSIKPREITWDEIVRQWSNVNGVIPYLPNSDARPEQIVSHGADAGAHQLVRLEMELIDRISGMSSATRGESASAAEGSAHFADRLTNSLMSQLDIFETFDAFRRERNRKIAGSF